MRNCFLSLLLVCLWVSARSSAASEEQAPPGTPLEITKRVLLAKLYELPAEVEALRPYVDPDLFKLLVEKSRAIQSASRRRLKVEGVTELAGVRCRNVFDDQIPGAGHPSFTETIVGIHAEVLMKDRYSVDGGSLEIARTTFRFEKRAGTWVLTDVWRVAMRPEEPIGPMQTHLRSDLPAEIAWLRKLR